MAGGHGVRARARAAAVLPSAFGLEERVKLSSCTTCSRSTCSTTACRSTSSPSIRRDLPGLRAGRAHRHLRPPWGARGRRHRGVRPPVLLRGVRRPRVQLRWWAWNPSAGTNELAERGSVPLSSAFLFATVKAAAVPVLVRLLVSAPGGHRRPLGLGGLAGAPRRALLTPLFLPVGGLPAGLAGLGSADAHTLQAVVLGAGIVAFRGGGGEWACAARPAVAWRAAGGGPPPAASWPGTRWPGVVYLVTFAVLWARRCPLPRCRGRPADDGTPIGSLPYVVACVAVCVWVLGAGGQGLAPAGAVTAAPTSARPGDGVGLPPAEPAGGHHEGHRGADRDRAGAVDDRRAVEGQLGAVSGPDRAEARGRRRTPRPAAAAWTGGASGGRRSAGRDRDRRAQRLGEAGHLDGDRRGILTDVVTAGPDRARAWASSSVVSMPKATGTPVVSCTCWTPAAPPRDDVVVGGLPPDPPPIQMTASTKSEAASACGLRWGGRRPPAPTPITTSPPSTPGAEAGRPGPRLSRSTSAFHRDRPPASPSRRGPRAHPPGRFPAPASPPECRMGHWSAVGDVTAHRRGPRAGGPCARAWCAGRRCSPGWAGSAAAPVR